MTTRTRRPRPALLVAGLLLVITAAACTGGAAPTPAASPTGAPPASGPASGSTTDPAADPSKEVRPVDPTSLPGEGVPPAIIAQATNDAAVQAGVDPSAVTVVSADAVTWPNGAAGCPKMGFLYTDVITPGYRVVVKAGDTTYDYRGSVRGGSVSWCQDAAPVAPGAAG
jgi:hypothetical protein